MYYPLAEAGFYKTDKQGNFFSFNLNTWYRPSEIIQCNLSTQNSYTDFVMAIARPQDMDFLEDVNISLRQILIVNLTDSFGSGKEPSLTWCQNNISYFEGSKIISTSDSSDSPDSYPIEITKPYIGINNKAKKIIKGYYGDSNNKARKFFEAPAVITYTGNYSDENVIMNDYEITADTSVVTGKIYYTESNNIYTEVTSPSGNPHNSGYYEKIRNPYRLLTFYSTGNLTSNKAITGDIWICGAGGNGFQGSASGNVLESDLGKGGGGGYVKTINDESFSSANITIGGPGTGYIDSSAAGGNSQITVNSITYTAYGGNKNSSGAFSRGDGGSGGGSTVSNANTQGRGDGIHNKQPFNSDYFPYCCSGGGCGFYYGNASLTYGYASNNIPLTYGGWGGRNGYDGYIADQNANTYGRNSYGGGQGGYYSSSTENSAPGDGITFGSGGGGGYYHYYSTGSKSSNGGKGAPGVCFIRIPLFDRS